MTKQNQERLTALINRFADYSLIRAVFQPSRTNNFHFFSKPSIFGGSIDKSTTPFSGFPNLSFPKYVF